MHKKPYTYIESNQELIKRIELEKEFAKYIAKDLMSQRYGVTTYCSTDRHDSTLMKKELCDWDSLKKPIQSRTYSNIVWRRDVYTNPNPGWLQWGSETPCCAGNPCELEYPDPVGSGSYIQLDIPLEIVINPNNFPNFDGNAQLYAFSSSDGNSPWITVGRATIPVNASSTNLGGAIIVNINGALFYRYQIYMNTGAVPNQGADQNDQIKFILVDGNLRWTVAFVNADWTTVGASNPGYNIVPASTVIDGCFNCYTNITIAAEPFSAIMCNIANQDCWFCGMEPNNPENPCPTSQEIIDNEDLSPAFSCVNDQECIYVEVLDQYNNPIPNYQIILDGELHGTTDENGVIKFSIPNASTNNFHTINDCEFCFYTTGNCNQQKITIKVDSSAAQAPCTIRAMKLNCKEGTYIDATIVDGPTPDNVNTSWVCDSVSNVYNGCVEIIDSEGQFGYSTEVECLQNCEPDPGYDVWRCVPNSADSCYCSQTWSPTPANPPINFASLEDCENCEECCCNPSDPEMVRVWECTHEPGITGCEAEVCTSFLVAGPIDWTNVPANFFTSQQACINGGCGCDDEIETITAYCEGGTCVEVQDPSLIPPWIGPEAQFTSLADCQSLCGGRGQGQKWVPESWYNANATSETQNVYPGMTFYSDNFGNGGDGACCVFAGTVDDDYNYGQLEWPDQQACEAMVGFCQQLYGTPQEVLTEFPYICLESQGTPQEGLFVWTPDAYGDLNVFPNYTGDTLEQKMLGDDFYCKYYDGFDLSNCVQEDGSSCAGDTPGSRMGRLKNADPQRLFNPETKFVIVPLFFSQNGQPWDGSIPEGSDTNGYDYSYYGVTGGNYYMMLPNKSSSCGAGFPTYSEASPSVYEVTDTVPCIPQGWYAPHCGIAGWTQSRTNTIHVFTDALDPNYSSQYYTEENPDFIPVCDGEDCIQMNGMNLDPELTSLINSFHFKNTIAGLHPDKVGINYWDWVFQESSQTAEAHGVRTGGPTNYYQAHVLRFGPVTQSGGEDLTQGARVSIMGHNDAVCGFTDNDSPCRSCHRPNWEGADFYRMGGPYMWLAFTLDPGYEEGGMNNIANMFIGNTNITKKCSGESCAANQTDAIDCTWGAPFSYNINPDQTI